MKAKVQPAKKRKARLALTVTFLLVAKKVEELAVDRAIGQQRKRVRLVFFVNKLKVFSCTNVLILRF